MSVTPVVVGQATVSSLLKGAVRDVLRGTDPLDGCHKTRLSSVCAALTTAALVELLAKYEAEHEAWRVSFADLDAALSRLPEDQRQQKAGHDLAASFNARWAGPAAARRLCVGASGIAAGGSLALRVGALARELETRYAEDPKARPSDQADALKRATAADLERVALEAKLADTREAYNLAGSLARVSLERDVLALVAQVADAARRRDAALEAARAWSAVP